MALDFFLKNIGLQMVALFLAILNRNYICINLYDEVRRLVYNFFHYN